MKKKKLQLNLKSIENEVEISDGYHTFDELYDHRITLWIALCRQVATLKDPEGKSLHEVWRSDLHSDGTMYKGQFILGMTTENGEQITYHLPASRIHETDFAETLGYAPKWDGHTSQDVLERIKKL